MARTPTARAETGAQADRPRTARPVALEIQALRALAVGLVMAYHLWPGAVRGGFIGVDVFFAVSGFLITGRLLRDIERSGRVHLGSFWAARAKRLLPASLLTLAVTAIGVFAWIPPARWPQTFREIGASALYVQNWLLAADSVDYLAADNAPSPVQHFWTLSVEEQFYVALPLLLAACLALGVRRLSPDRRRRALGVVLAVVVVASAGYSILLTASAAPVAYFSTLTRAWEFALGGLLAVAGGGWSGRAADAGPARWRTAGSWAGVAMILAAGLGYTAATPFPSVTAALPVAGALLVMAAGWRPGRAGTAIWMRWRGVQRLGDISYSAYLWHWPLIVLVPYAIGGPTSLLGQAAILLGSLALAYASWRWVENPVRYSPRLLGTARPRLVAAWSAGGMALVVAVAAIGVPLGARLMNESIAQGRALADAGTRCFGALAPAEPDAAAAGATGAGASECDNRALTGVLAPDPAVADQDSYDRPECWDSVASDELKRCTYGPATGYTKRIAVIGDSHANQHATALIEIAKQRGWQLSIMGKNGCYLSRAVVIRDVSSYETQCETWKGKVRSFLADSGPFDAIIVTHAADAPVRTEPGQSQSDAVVSGLVEEWQALRAEGLTIIALRDNPTASQGIVDCVRDNRRDERSCARPRGQAVRDFETQAAAAQVPGVQVVDLTDRYCTAELCLPVVNHAVVYRNEGHITETFSRTLAPILGERLDQALAAAAP